MKTVVFAFHIAVALLASHSVFSAEAPQLEKDFRIRDPFVLVDGGKYYLYESKPWSGGNGVQVRVSDDLDGWSPKTPAMTLPKELNVSAVWAPEVHKYKGRYYMFVTLTQPKGTRPVKVIKKGCEHMHTPRGTWAFVADSPMGPFKPTKMGPVPPADHMTLDGTLYVEDGKPYMVYCHEWCQMGNGTVEYAPLTADFSSLETEPVKLLDARSAMPGAASVTDGVFFYRSEKSGRLYMIWSNMISGHGYTVLVRHSLSGKIAGPWSKDSLLLGKDGGHAMIFKDLEGKLRITLHRPNRSPHERMRLFYVNDDGERLTVTE